jgi:hypothetical protein
MKKLLLAACATFVSLTAQAADLSTKAPVAAPIAYCTPQNCSGLYGGFGFVGTGTNLDIIGGGLNQSIFAAGGTIKVQGGYQLWSGNWFAAIDLSLGGEFTTTNNSTAVIMPSERSSSRLYGSELVRLGYNFFPSSQSATVAPSQSPVPLLVPANLFAASTPYVQCGGLQRRGRSSGACGAGFETVIAAGWTSNIGYLNSPSQNGLPADNLVMIEINKHF